MLSYHNLVDGILDYLEIMRENNKNVLPFYTASATKSEFHIGTVDDVRLEQHSIVTSAGRLSPQQAEDALEKIAEQIKLCKNCELYKTRTQVVPGQGNPCPELMFVGEAPGVEEDKQGQSFVGAAGQVLTRLINKMGFTRDEVFIANICKCHPPGITKANEKPTPEQMKACIHFLIDQIAILQPKVIVALGSTAVEGLFDLQVAKITKRRGNWMDFNGIPVMPTFHPSYLLHNRSKELYWQVWEDMTKVLTFLNRPIPKIDEKR